VIDPLRQSPPNKFVAVLWAMVLVPITLGLGLALTIAPAFIERDTGPMLGLLIGGIVAFALVFAVNSAVHSYLVVRYANGDKVRATGWDAHEGEAGGRERTRGLHNGRAPRRAVVRTGRAVLTARARFRAVCAAQVATDVGFYYMANACGRLIGTLASGALYSYAAPNPTLGFAACMWASTAFCVLSGAIVALCRDDVGGLACGPCLRFGGARFAAVAAAAPATITGTAEA
jgi:hypothetical protein